MLEKRLNLIRDLAYSKNICSKPNLYNHNESLKKIYSYKHTYILIKQHRNKMDNIIIIIYLDKILGIISLMEFIYYSHLLNNVNLNKLEKMNLNDNYYKWLKRLCLSWDLEFNSFEEVEKIINKYNINLLYLLTKTISLTNRELTFKKICFLLKKKLLKKKLVWLIKIIIRFIILYKCINWGLYFVTEYNNLDLNSLEESVKIINEQKKNIDYTNKESLKTIRNINREVSGEKFHNWFVIGAIAGIAIYYLSFYK